MEVDAPEEKKDVRFKSSLKGDYTEEVKVRVPEIVGPVQGDPAKLPGALAQLLLLEKRTRLAADSPSTQALARAILDQCFECKQWETLNEQISVLCKRRAQLRKVIATVVQHAMKMLDEAPDKKTRVALIETLRTVSAGKLMVELERARLTTRLAAMREAEGKVDEACELMQDVQVETIGSMELREKAEILLEQIRLCIAKKDWIRAFIVSKKVDKDKLREEGWESLKLKFYGLMIRYFEHESAFFDCCKCHYAVFNTPSVEKDEKKSFEAMKKTAMFLVLAPFDSEVSDMIFRIKLMQKKLALVPIAAQLIDLFTTQELIPWPFPQSDRDTVGEFKKLGYEEEFRKAVVQHNIRVLASYYNRLESGRLNTLLGLPDDLTERYLSEMVQSKQLYARIDRPARIVTFARKKTPNEVVDEWSSDVGKLLSLVENTCHLINKEIMVNKIKKKKK